MKQRTVLALVAVLALNLGGCGFDIFEDVQTDPHPPVIFDLVVSPTTVRFDTDISVQVGYADDGADITMITLKDRDSAGLWSIVPLAPPVPEGSTEEPETAPEFFPGVRGIARTDPAYPLTISFSQPGEHRIQVWAEDSHGSRSNKLEFVLNAVL